METDWFPADDHGNHPAYFEVLGFDNEDVENSAPSAPKTAKQWRRKTAKHRRRKTANLPKKPSRQQIAASGRFRSCLPSFLINSAAAEIRLRPRVYPPWRAISEKKTRTGLQPCNEITTSVHGYIYANRCAPAVRSLEIRSSTPNRRLSGIAGRAARPYSLPSHPFTPSSVSFVHRKCDSRGQN
jgi:hypothetical protein